MRLGPALRRLDAFLNTKCVSHAMWFKIISSATRYLVILVPCMAVGVLLVNFLTLLGWTRKLAVLVRPIISFGHLSPESGLSFITSFGSSAVANSMLAEAHRKGSINKTELFIAVLVNGFPAMVAHWRSMIPILIPLLGTTGVIYFLILVGASLVRSFGALVVGRVVLERKTVEAQVGEEKETPAFRDACRLSFQQSKPLLKKVVYVTIPVTFVVFTLLHVGVFDALAKALSGLAAWLPIAPAGIGIIAAQFGGTVPAYTVGSNLLTEGVISGKDVILALLTGNVLTSVVSLRFLIPYYVGIGLNRFAVVC